MMFGLDRMDYSARPRRRSRNPGSAGGRAAFLVAVALVAALPCGAGPVSLSPPADFTAGTAITASAVNGDFDTLYGNDDAMNTYLGTIVSSQWASGTGTISYTAGNVGIGITPSQRLHVYSTSTGNVALFSGGTSGDTAIRVENVGGAFARVGASTSAYGYVLGNPMLALYSGSGASTYRAIIIDSSGKVGIGVNAVTTPNALTVGNSTDAVRLDVSGTLSLLYLGSFATGASDGLVAYESSSGIMSFSTGTHGSLSTRVLINALGLWVPSLSSNGPVYSNGTLLTNIAPSSRQYKHDIAAVDLEPERVLGLEPKSFVWNNGGEADFGLIAEEVREVLPELYRDDGTTVGYDVSKLPFYLIELAKVQQQRIEALENQADQEMQALREENAGLKARLEAVEAKLGD